GGVKLARQYDVAVAGRPLGERFTLSADYLFEEAGGLAAGRLAYAVNAEVVKGLRVSAGVSHGLRSTDPLFVQLGLTVDTARFRLGASGKQVVAVLLTAEDADYVYASAADRVYATPESVLLIDGFAASSTFIGGSMDKLGVKWDVARVGAYKNAPDALTRTEMS